MGTLSESAPPVSCWSGGNGFCDGDPAEPYSSLRLPERDLAPGGCGNDAPPSRGALAWRKQDRGSESPRPLGRLGDLGDLDVGQPDRALGAALDDAAAQLGAQPKRLVGAVAAGDPLRPPSAELCVERAGAHQIAGVQLEMDERCRSGCKHALSPQTRPGGRTHRRSGSGRSRSRLSSAR